MSNLIRYYNPLDRAFDRALGVLLPSVNGDSVSAGRAIALDVVETPEAYIVKAELPGIAKDKIEVNVEDRDVTIGAEHRRKGYAAEAVVLLLRFMFAERRYHSIARHGGVLDVFGLPDAPGIDVPGARS